jgi:hypothetical protein
VDMVAQAMKKVNNVFDGDTLMKLARETGFVRRSRKIDPKVFLETIIFLRLEFPNSSLEDLVFEFYKNNIAISKQALHKKFNETGVRFVQKVLDELLKSVTYEHKLHLELVPFVNDVKVIDSSEIRLNKVLKDVFPQVRNQGAAIKLQALMDVVSNQILSLDIRPSNEPDQKYRDHITHILPGNLLIGDLGYFCVDSFNEIQKKEGFFLSRYFKQTYLYDLHTEEQIDLRSLLNQSQETEEKIELEIALGASRFPCKLVAIKLTETAYQQRLKNLAEKHRKDPRSKASEYDALNQWTIFVTNFPLPVESDVLLRLYSLRWQIELLFKMMKTFLSLRSVDSTNAHRTSISLYVSLIAMTLLGFVATTIVDKEISLYKASKVFVKNIRIFFTFMNKKICPISWCREILCTFALKESRPKRASTKLSLGLSHA